MHGKEGYNRNRNQTKHRHQHRSRLHIVAAASNPRGLDRPRERIAHVPFGEIAVGLGEERSAVPALRVHRGETVPFRGVLDPFLAGIPFEDPVGRGQQGVKPPSPSRTSPTWDVH